MYIETINILLLFTLVLLLINVDAKEKNAMTFIVEVRHRSTKFIRGFTSDEEEEEIFDAKETSAVGTVLNQRYVLTTRKFSLSIARTMLVILVGGWKLGNFERKISVERVIVADKNPLGLLKTQYNLRVRKSVWPKLINAPIDTETLFVYTINMNSKLMAPVSEKTLERCNQMLPMDLEENEVCYSAIPCKTLGGSPVINGNNELVAIHSGAKKMHNCHTKLPFGAFPINNFTEWIQDNLSV